MNTDTNFLNNILVNQIQHHIKMILYQVGRFSVHACNTSTCDVEPGGLLATPGVQGQSDLQTGEILSQNKDKQIIYHDQVGFICKDRSRYINKCNTSYKQTE